MSVHLSCRNMDCRILTYVGIAERPLDRCPVCQSVGSLASDIQAKSPLRMPAVEYVHANGNIEYHTYQALDSPKEDGTTWCVYESHLIGRGRCGLPPGHACHSYMPV